MWWCRKFYGNNNFNRITCKECKVSEDNYPSRKAFCKWFRRMCTWVTFSIIDIVFMNEARFTKNDVINFHNMLYWSEENPHAIIHSRHQQQILYQCMGRNYCRQFNKTFHLAYKINRSVLLWFFAKSFTWITRWSFSKYHMSYVVHAWRCSASFQSRS